MAVMALAQAILGFAAIVCAGVVLRVTGIVAREDARALNAVIICVGLPAFVFKAVHGAAVGVSALYAVGIAWLVFAAVLGVALLASRVLGLEGGRKGAFLLASSLGNTGYIGYPLTAALLGPAAVPVAVFYDVFGTVMQLVLVGFALARRFGNRQVQRARLGVLGELVTFPALLAAVLAIVLSPVPVPKPVSDWLGLLASMVAPLIMLSVGISLRPRAIVHGATQLGVVTALRLVLAPLLAALVTGLFVADPAAHRTAVLEAGVPTMMLTLAVGERFGLDNDFIAAAVFVTTAASAVTLPLAQLMLG